MNSSTGELIYTPPPAFEVPVLMSDMAKWLNSDLDIHPVLVSGIAQFQLVHIHPFFDGNGRASRLLSTLYLYKAGYDFKRLFTISEYYDRDPPSFYKAIQSVRESGMDMTGWLEYFITGLETQMIEVKERGEQFIKKDALVRKHDLNPRQGKALGFLLEYKKLTLCDYEKLCHDVNKRSLQRDLKGLLGKGVLFDPVIQSHLGVIPEWSNGVPENLGEGDFIVTSCAQAAAELADIDIPGILVRPKL